MRKITSLILCWDIIVIGAVLFIGNVSGAQEVDDKLDLSAITIEKGFAESQIGDPSISLPLDVTLHPGETCNRACNVNETRVCHFNWFLEHFHAMGPVCKRCAEGVIADCFHPQCITVDGLERSVMSINRKIPGPPIHVCLNDLVVVDITNRVGGSSAAIHWHGFHQRESPFMDGVPFVTQCPIQFGASFRYAFRATQAGTQFYHSHSGHHKVNGQYGAFIVRQPRREDVNSVLYNYDLAEHTIVASDWMNYTADMFVRGNPTLAPGIDPTSLLINGRGVTINPNNGQMTRTPLAVFHVTKGQSYRFRFINSASFSCGLQLQIEKHRMNIIATDSYQHQSRIVDTLLSSAGERFDFVVAAQEVIGTYWIRLRATGPCDGRNIEQFAILSYNTGVADEEQLSVPSRRKPNFDEAFDEGVRLNHPNATCYLDTDADFCISDLHSYWPQPEAIKRAPDHQFFLSFDNYRIPFDEIFSEHNSDSFMNVRGDIVLLGAMNNISFVFPSSYPSVDDAFCDTENLPTSCANRQICPCTHRLKIRQNSVVELIIVDESRNIRQLYHPFHLHGYHMHLVGMGQQPVGTTMTVSLAKEMSRLDTLVRMPVNNVPPIKDTISIPSRGYAIVRFIADNPGFWLMHCHYEWHLAMGMGLILQVGERADMIKPPKKFHTCGNYKPNIISTVMAPDRDEL